MRVLLIAVLLAATGLSAQTLKDIKLDMAQVQVGQTVTATVGLSAVNTPNCGLRVRWGDGAVTERKINTAEEIPFQTSHVYAKPGDYTVLADPGRVGGSLGCVGKIASVLVKVVAPPPPPPPPLPRPTTVPAPAVAAPTVVAGPSCPEGWKLDAKSVVKKTGAYSCSAKAETAVPDKRTTCPGELTYFENSKKGVLGCKP